MPYQMLFRQGALFSMANCPACRSTRVYKGYRPAPFLLRIFFIHDFLCENCNLQFRGFSLTPPRSRRRKSKKSSDQSPTGSGYAEATSTVAVADALPPNPVIAQANAATASGMSQALPTTPMSSHKNSPPPSTVQGQWQMPAQALEELEGKRRSHRSHQVCPTCGATDTERRRRKLWEKVIFVFTTIRAYQCRICGADFYARRQSKESEPRSS